MLSNQVLNKVMTEMHQILEKDCSLWDVEGKCLNTTCKQQSYMESKVCELVEEKERDPVCFEGDMYFPIRSEDETVYIFVIHNCEKEMEGMGRLCVSQFTNLLQAYKTKLSKNQFFQNLILDNLLLVDILNQAKKLKIDIEKRRAIFVVEPKKEGDEFALETLKGLYATGTKDFVTSVDAEHIILVKALESTQDYQDLKAIARAIVDTVNMEAMVDVRVAYGTIVDNLKDVSRTYKEANMALDVGRIFYMGKNVLAYNELGIGRLIYQLPNTLCKMFLEEVFHGNALDQFDEEALSIINAFFENDLNISETARKLYLHRNTLVYRLEKIQKMTGLDIRKFDDALTFKIALMVSSQMKFEQSKKQI